MNKEDLNKIIQYIVDQGVDAIRTHTNETDFVIDYLAIFSKSKGEYHDFLKIVKTLGTEVDPAKNSTGFTFSLHDPIPTNAGMLKFLKIRKPDPTRPQRGGPDFKINDYEAFKTSYMKKSGNFALIPRKGFEMIEIKGIDVLVYIPNKLTTERLKRPGG